MPVSGVMAGFVLALRGCHDDRAVDARCLIIGHTVGGQPGNNSLLYACGQFKRRLLRRYFCRGCLTIGIKSRLCAVASTMSAAMASLRPPL